MSLNTDPHTLAMFEAFGEVLKAEDVARLAKKELDDETVRLSSAVAAANNRLAAALGKVASLMKESGEFEVVLPGDFMDYKIGWSTPRESIKVVDPDAVPDGFVKLERKPMLKEIGEHLRTLREGGLDLPNWAAFSLGEPKLGWKAVKRGAA